MTYSLKMYFKFPNLNIMVRSFIDIYIIFFWNIIFGSVILNGLNEKFVQTINSYFFGKLVHIKYTLTLYKYKFYNFL